MREFFRKYFSDIKEVLDLIELDKFEEIAKVIFATIELHKQIFTMGNGGSGSTASHLVCDLNKGIGKGYSKRFKAICLNDNIPTILAYANDLSYSDIFIEQLKNFMAEKDIIIAFSGSGNSENILKAVDYANNHGGITIGFSGFDGGKLAKIAKYSLVAPINDMQKSEDVHFILAHLIMQTMNRYICNKD